jgi:hypothetical protein
MPENNETTTEVVTTAYDTVTTEDTDETDGTPVGLILVAGGFIVGGLIGLGRKLFKKKKYAEVDRGEGVTIVKDK